MDEKSVQLLIQRLVELPGGELHFSAEGVWSHAGSEFTHPGVIRYFSERLRWSAEHQSYVVADAAFAVRVVVEDTPFVVTALDTATIPWQLELNSGHREPLNFATLSVGADNAWYCEATADCTRVRFQRKVAQELWTYVEEVDGGYAVRCGEALYRIAEKDEK